MILKLIFENNNNSKWYEVKAIIIAQSILKNQKLDIYQVCIILS